MMGDWAVTKIGARMREFKFKSGDWVRLISHVPVPIVVVEVTPDYVSCRLTDGNRTIPF